MLEKEELIMEHLKPLEKVHSIFQAKSRKNDLRKIKAMGETPG